MKDKDIDDQKNTSRLTLTNGLIATINALCSILIFVIDVSKRDLTQSENVEDGWRDGHSGYGFYVGDIRSDDE
ncbi:hypothetical protein YKD1_07840 [Yersinia pseudotuberculosis]|uniref:Uncharacterized protein n=1 Tax=Yersinia similis TaxID=367190 RepID=A0A0T9RT60_9GAMM|nr:hypothetical protein [Yersinia similis]CNI82987.1 Uncharacterised protein [Yersinia similis]